MKRRQNNNKFHDLGKEKKRDTCNGPHYGRDDCEISEGRRETG
jgi:hypothetical protein